MTTVALIVAGGSGLRFGGGQPKQYAMLAGKPVLRRTLERFLASPLVDAVQVVIGAGHEAAYAEAVAGLDLPPVVHGGGDRQASVLAGLLAIEALRPAKVLVQDAARPLVSAALIERVVAALDVHPAVLPVVAVADTLKRVEGERVQGELSRDAVRRSQTPQGFHMAPLLAAHRAHAGAGLTDDAAVVAREGVEVVTVEGEESNIKITQADDLRRAEALLRQAEAPRWRTGMGFDVHALVAGRRLMLAGIEVPHERGLAGHSDADVALHAITDALLGSIAEGDIGSHFPPSDPRWRDVDSAVFLEHAAHLVEAAGGRIEHVDLTIICEAPKIGPHRPAMRARIAQLLRLGIDQVSVKATTTERLGFTGRGEGIAAQAVVTICLLGSA